MALGLVQIYWGDGKGKTTAALGTALRACGSGLTVHLVQFMKNGTGNSEIDYPGELKALQRLSSFSVKRFGTGKWVIGRANPDHIAKVNEAYSYLLSCLGKYDLIIADEILYAVQLDLLQETDVLQLIDKKPSAQELILTGSHKPFAGIFKKADLVTQMRKIKHPFDKGILARKGIEY